MADRHRQPPRDEKPREDKDITWLAPASLALGIPLSASAGGTGDLPGLVVAWIGIVGVNAVHALGRSRSR